MLIYKAFGRAQRLQKPHIFRQRSHQKIMFFWHPFWDLFLDFLKHPGAKMLDFGTPWRSVVPKIAPKITQVAPKACKKVPERRFWLVLAVTVLTDLLPRSILERSLAPFWLILDDFRWIWSSFLIEFGIVLHRHLEIFRSSPTNFEKTTSQ